MTTDAVDQATARYLAAAAEAEAARQALFDACADAVRGGEAPDALATRTPFTAVTIRKELRERGVERLRSGPKPRKRPAGGSGHTIDSGKDLERIPGR